MQAPEGFEKRFLRAVLGLVTVANRAQTEVIDCPVVAFDERAEGLGPPGQG